MQPLTTETEASEERYTQVSEFTSDSTERVSPHSKSLQVLKDALDRATKIVRPTTPNTDDSCPSSPFKTYENFEVTMDDSQRSIFEDLYDLQANDDDAEIKSIEKFTMQEDTFLFDKYSSDGTVTSKGAERESTNDITVSVTSLERAGYSHDTTYNRNFVCESIAEVSSEFNSSYNDGKFDKRVEPSMDQTVSIEDYEKHPESMENPKTTVERSDVEDQVDILEDENQPDMTSFNLLLLNETPKNKNCRTCHESALPRRRSLPAALSQLRAINNSALGKLPIRRGVSIKLSKDYVYVLCIKYINRTKLLIEK